MSALARFALLLALLLDPLQAIAQEETLHPREYWKVIVENEFALPDGESAYELIVELSSYLASTDSELRDDFGYGIPAAWIYRQELLDASQLSSLRQAWTRNLEHEIGSRGDESVLLRSFSALNLSLLAAYDNQIPFMQPEGFSGLLAAALGYLENERDLRGWEAPAGWHHSAAHTADLLKFLARSKHLLPKGQGQILAAIAQRLRDTDGYVFVHGEDERLAATVVSIMARDDLDSSLFEGFVAEVAASAKRHREAAGFDPDLFAALQNSKNFLRALHVHLAKFEDIPAELHRLRKLVLTTLWEM